MGFALLKGVSPNRTWLVYTQSPNGDLPGVTVSVPDYQNVVFDVTKQGSFFIVEESEVVDLADYTYTATLTGTEVPAVPLNMTDTELYENGEFSIGFVIARELIAENKMLLNSGNLNLMVNKAWDTDGVALYLSDGTTNVNKGGPVNENFHHILFTISPTELLMTVDGVDGTPVAHNFVPSGLNFKDSTQPSPIGELVEFKVWKKALTAEERTEEWVNAQTVITELETAEQNTPEPTTTKVGVMTESAPFTAPTSYADVTDFGAVGDGVTDNRQAFINALAANPNVYVPAGEYYSSTKHHLLTQTKVLFGEGTLTSGDSGATVGAYNVSLSDLTINGLTFKSTSTIGIYIDSQNITNMTVQNCTFIGSETTAKNAITLVGVEAGRIDTFNIINNTFTDIPRACIEVLQRATDRADPDIIKNLYIANNKATIEDGHLQDGFNPFVSFSSNVSSSTVEHNYVSGYMWGIEFAHNTNATARYNVMVDIKSNLFSIEDAPNLLIEYNYLQGGSIHTTGSVESTTGSIQNNTIYDASFNLQNETTSGTLTISDNFISTSDYSAVVFNGCTNTIVENNYIESSNTSNYAFLRSVNAASDNTNFGRNNRMYNPEGRPLSDNYAGSVQFYGNTEVAQEQPSLQYN